MKISLGIYPNETPADIIASAKLADEMGYSTLWVLDSHLSIDELAASPPVSVWAPPSQIPSRVTPP